MTVFLLLRGLPLLIELGLLIFCLIDCIQTPTEQVRNLPKVTWVVLIVVLPLIGGIGWLFLGRPSQARSGVPWPSGPTAGYPEFERPRRAAAPDDDPAFLSELGRVNQEQERTLAQWEADLKRREQELRNRADRPVQDGDQDRPIDG
jgi:hypothetical protein